MPAQLTRSRGMVSKSSSRKIEKAQRRYDLRKMIESGEHLQSKEAYVRYVNLAASQPVNRNARVPIRFYYKHLFPEPGAVMLDVGAWIGNNLFHFAALGHEIDGVEVATPYVETISERLADQPPEVGRRIRVFNCLVEDFEPDRQYDIALAGEILTHVPSPVSTIEAIARSLKSGGLLFVASPKEQQRTEARNLDGAQLRAIVEGVGFRIQQLFVTHPIKTKEWGVAQWICKATKE